MEFLDYLEEKVNHTYKPEECKSKFKIKDIFNDHWYSFLKDNPNLNIRPVVIEEVEKMMSCGSLSNGYAVYTCDHCHNYLYVPFSCKSRFCCSCGTKYTLDRADTIARKSITALIGTLLSPFIKTYGLFFKKIGLYLICFLMLFLLLFYLGFMTKIIKKILLLGFISTLHTFGRDLKWNLIFTFLLLKGLLAILLLGRNLKSSPILCFVVAFKLLYFLFLKNVLVRITLKFLKIIFTRLLKTVSMFMLLRLKLVTSKLTVKYVIRYSGKPAMAQSRILNYDGEYVTFWYDRHEDNQRVEETIHAYDFIKRLIIHIYDKYFNVVRYYGLYAKKHKFSDKFIHMLKPHVAEFRKQLKNWRCRIELYFKHDPLICSCGHTFHFDYIVNSVYNSS